MKKVRAVLGVLVVALVAAGFSEAGTITGNVEVHPKPPRRSSQRYQSGAGGEIPPVASIPTLVYIKGTVAGSRATAPKELSIVQRDRQFMPDHLIVPVGAEVSFPNDDEEFHNVFSYSKTRRFDLGRYPRGETKSVTFDKPGVVKVYCEVHPWMRAAVLVVENPFHTVVAADGSFTLDGVPPGTYTMVVWDVDVGSEQTEVTVPADGSAKVDLRLADASAGRLPEHQLTVPGHRTAEPDIAIGSCCASSRTEP